ncbi:hypothetical protein [Cohnella soli]|uniref:Glycosyl hydrolase 36 catalytic domain-containing protein n=1 Tax=Cohnella soli TaxID=425005 RepID=A0ABW0HXU0_9BACL
MSKLIAVEWKDDDHSGIAEVTGGKIISGAIVKGEGSYSSENGAFSCKGPCRLELHIEETNLPNEEPVIVSVQTDSNPFSFFLRDVCQAYPIYIPVYGVIVTDGEDERSYSQVEHDIRSQGLLTQLQQIRSEQEHNFDLSSKQTRDLPSQTWLGLSRDIRIFGVSFRGVGSEDRLWDWIQPRFHGYEVPLAENDNKPVRYSFMLGRGIGCKSEVTRRLDAGKLPILHAKIVDDDITYHTTSFVSYENSELNSQTHRGTHYSVSDSYGTGHMLTEEQEELRQEHLHREMNREEETILYFRVEAVNTASVPRYAWFKNVTPNAWGTLLDYDFDGSCGFASYSDDRVFAVSKCNGRQLTSEETALLIKPGESAVIEFYLPHRPISRQRAVRLAEQNFSARLEECRKFWKDKLSLASSIHLPEQRLDEMVKAGLLHLDLVTYGLEPQETLVPTIGVYTAIGSESSPIIQFFDSIGLQETARRALTFFLDKQHDDGFIQNFGEYMLETGAVLWSIGEHYRYTRDESWIAQIKPKLLKSYDYLLKWRERNLTEELQGKGYGMLEGKTADPEDPFRSFMLNGYACMGISRLAEMLAASDPALSGEIRETAETFREHIRAAFFRTLARSPVVPLGDGSWVPSAPPWVEYRGPLSLFAEGGKWFTHGSVFTRDSLLGPLYLLFHEIIRPDEVAADFLLNVHSELMCTGNVAFSQPYYSIHPWVHLKRGEVKAFLKAYYNGFSGLADRETYTFWEHFFHASPHKTHEEGWFLMQTRWMLYMEEGEMLKLLPGIPRNWLEDGKVIELREVASYFGPVSLYVESQLERGVIVAQITGTADRRPKSVTVRLPHPDGRTAVSVVGGTYSAQQETVRIDDFTGSAEIRLQF